MDSHAGEQAVENPVIDDGSSQEDRTRGRRLWRRVAPTLFDVGCLTAFWLLFFWQIVVAQDHLIPFDLIDQHYMFQAFVQRALSEGQSLWWTPSILSGYPIAADPLTALFYPPNLTMHLLTRGAELPYFRLEFQTALHFLWAAIGTYLLARALTGSRAGAILAALTFAFGAFFAWHLPHLSPISSISWLAWILWAFYHAMRTRGPFWPFWAGLAALAYGMMILAGHALTILQTGYLLLGLTALLVIRGWRADRRKALTLAATGGAILALGAGLAMVQLVLSWELSGESERTDLTYEDATGSSYLPQGMLTAVIPNFYDSDDPGKYWASGDIAETNMYVGLLPLVLAAVALLRGRAEDREITLLIFGLGLLALLVAFGSNTWLYRIAFDLFPGVDRVRRPLNSIAFVHLALGLLAAFGVRTLTEPGPAGGAARDRTLVWLRRAFACILGVLVLIAVALAATFGGAGQPILSVILNGVILAGVIVALIYLVLRGWQTSRLSAGTAVILLVLIAALDLGTANAGKVYRDHAARPDSYIGTDWAGSPSDPVVRFLQSQQAALAPDRARIYPNRAGSIWENGPLVWQLDSAYGYSVLWPAEYRKLHDVATADPGKPLIDLMNIRYLILSQPIEAVYPQADLSRYRLAIDSSVKVYENLGVRPRVEALPEAIHQSEQDALAWMQANAGQLDHVVVIDEPVEGRSAPGATQPGMVEIVDYRNSRVQVHASMPQAGWVVLFDSYYPGWSATIDGAPAEVLRADSAYRAVWVPQGEHEIEFSYSPRHLWLGIVVSALSALAIVALLIAGLALGIRARQADSMT